MGLIALSSKCVAADENIMEVVLLVGLAVGVDYALFYMRREREERAAGRSEGAALAAAAATSGRAVLVSGMTVLIAMAGMFLSGDKTFMSFSVGTMIVVAVAMVGSLTVLPAVLSSSATRSRRAGSRSSTAAAATKASGRIWGAILDRVLRHPVVSAVLAGRCSSRSALPDAPAAHRPDRHRGHQRAPAVEPIAHVDRRLPRHAGAGRRRHQGRRRQDARASRTRSPS